MVSSIQVFVLLAMMRVWQEGMVGGGKSNARERSLQLRVIECGRERVVVLAGFRSINNTLSVCREASRDQGRRSSWHLQG